MRRVFLLLASIAVALLLASGVAMVATLAVPEEARAAFPGKNGKIAFLSDRAGGNEIYTISFRNGEWGDAKRLTFDTRSDKTPAFSPNGKKIVWERGDKLYKMDADGTDQQRIPNTIHDNYEIGRYGSHGGNPAYSPGGGRIVFDKNKNIYTINADGTNPTRITGVPADATLEDPTFVHPVWSPVGDEIAFSWLHEGASERPREIHVMSLSELANKQFLDASSRITPAGIDVYRPDWSPDGTRIVYECSEDPCEDNADPTTPNANIYRVDADGSNNTPIVTSRFDESYPVFSPGGGKIAFSSDRTTGPNVDNPTGDEELFIKNANGSGDPLQITFNRARDVEPDWQPIVR